MVTTEYILNAALHHDTVVSRAFLRALGVTPSKPKEEPNKYTFDAYADIDYCFSNWGSPMNIIT